MGEQKNKAELLASIETPDFKITITSAGTSFWLIGKQMMPNLEIQTLGVNERHYRIILPEGNLIGAHYAEVHFHRTPSQGKQRITLTYLDANHRVGCTNGGPSRITIDCVDGKPQRILEQWVTGLEFNPLEDGVIARLKNGAGKLLGQMTLHGNNGGIILKTDFHGRFFRFVAEEWGLRDHTWTRPTQHIWNMPHQKGWHLKRSYPTSRNFIVRLATKFWLGKGADIARKRRWAVLDASGNPKKCATRWRGIHLVTTTERPEPFHRLSEKPSAKF